MYLTIKQFVETIGEDKISVLCGNKKLEQTALRGGQAAEGADAWKEVEYGELLFISGIGLREPTQELLDIAKKLAEKEAILVVRLNTDLPQIPEKVFSYCKGQGMILMSIAEHVKIQPIMRKMYEMLFEEENQHASVEKMVDKLIHGNYGTQEAQNAYRLGFENGKEYVAVVLMLDDFFSVIEERGKEYYLKLQKQVLNKVEQFLELHNKTIHFSIIDNNAIVLLIKNEGVWIERDFLNRFFEKLSVYMEEQDPDITVSAGIGSLFTQLSEIRRSVIEARRSLQIAHVCGRRKVIRSYDDIGIYRLLFELQDQEIFDHIRNGIIGRLREYDMVNNDNLVETLRIYLENDRNIGVSAAQMFLHRNTLKYRLKKIEEILLCDLSDVNVCFNLRLAFKIDNFLKSEKSYYE